MSMGSEEFCSAIKQLEAYMCTDFLKYSGKKRLFCL
jgi:hypothetical protein